MPSNGLNILRQFFHITNSLVPSGFGSILQVHTPSIMTLKSFDNKTKTVYCSYKVPSHLCVARCGGDGGDVGVKSLPLSVLMALFDDITTWPIIASDTSHRAGVSVFLSAEYTQPHTPLLPSTVLTMEGTVMKLGNRFAFCEVEARDEMTGRLVAIGRHTKYLPMGVAYEFAFKYCMNLLEALAISFGKFGKKNDEANARNANENTSILDFCQINNSHNPTKNTLEATFKVLPHSRNPMGGLHGGCTAVLSELAAEELVNGRKEKRKGSIMFLRQMSVTYASTGKGEVAIRAEKVESGKEDDCDCTTAVKVLRVGKGGGLVSEGMLHWVK